MSELFHIILYQPIFNLLVGLYNILPHHDLGLAIILVTVIVRAVLYPLTGASIKAQKSMQEMQPKLAAINEEFKNDPQKRAQAMMQLYKVHKVNPMTSCLPVLIQLPFLIALFWVLRDGIASTDLVSNLYSFVHNPGKLNPLSFGFLDLSKPSYVLAVLAGAAQYLQARSNFRKQPPKAAGAGAKDESMAAAMNNQMMYMMPLLTVILGIRFAAGLTLYWFFGTVLMIAQQWYLNRKHTNDSTKPGSPIIEGKIVS